MPVITSLDELLQLQSQVISKQKEEMETQPFRGWGQEKYTPQVGDPMLACALLLPGRHSKRKRIQDSAPCRALRARQVALEGAAHDLAQSQQDPDQTQSQSNPGKPTCNDQ